MTIQLEVSSYIGRKYHNVKLVIERSIIVRPKLEVCIRTQ